MERFFRLFQDVFGNAVCHGVVERQGILAATGAFRVPPAFRGALAAPLAGLVHDGTEPGQELFIVLSGAGPADFGDREHPREQGLLQRTVVLDAFGIDGGDEPLQVRVVLTDELADVRLDLVDPLQGDHAVGVVEVEFEAVGVDIPVAVVRVVQHGVREVQGPELDHAVHRRVDRFESVIVEDGFFVVFLQDVRHAGQEVAGQFLGAGQVFLLHLGVADRAGLPVRGDVDASAHVEVL